MPHARQQVLPEPEPIPPLKDTRAKTTVLSAVVKSHNEDSILVENGHFTPVRWFLEHGHDISHNDEPPRKRLKAEIKDLAPALNGLTTNDLTDTDIPLADLTLDLEINHVNYSDDEPQDTKEHLPSSPLPVFVYGVDSTEYDTRMHFTLPHSYGKSPVLILTCQHLPSDVVSLLRHIALPSRQLPPTLSSRNAPHPATYTSCTLTSQSVGDSIILRLHASVSWRSGTSAFPAGYPSGPARNYVDYDLLLNAFPDYEREKSDHTMPWKPQDFYESVHVTSPTEITPSYDDILDSSLFPFQRRAVTWMLKREGVGFDGKIEKIDRRTRGEGDDLFSRPVVDPLGQKCYVNHLQGIVSRTDPVSTQNDVSGGLLAEEMGLGKTVELLALIMTHKRDGFVPGLVNDSESNTKVLASKATLIITPNSILQQWKSEIGRHAPALKVLHYDGIPSASKTKTYSEKDVLKDLTEGFDIVLTTYNVLGKEVYFAEDPPDRNMRHARKHERPRSPLVQVQWWRICLDEAQMVESGVTAAARVARRLPRVHSWAVTGTPLRKDVQDLFGLLIFLRYRPLCEEPKLWAHLIRYHKHLFQKIFGQIALRHTKAKVRDELSIPPQKRVVVTMPFSVVEQQNYTNLFNLMCDDVGLDRDGAPLNGEWDPNDSSVVEVMRTWLMRLRQTCLHPQVGSKNRRALGRGTAPLRTVAEVLEVMIEQNEAGLRTGERQFITSSLLRAHIIGNNEEDQNRSVKARVVYEECMKSTMDMVSAARKRLATIKMNMAEKKLALSDAEDSESESTPLLGQAKHNLRNALELLHISTFFTATAIFQIKSNEALTQPDSQDFKDLEEAEVRLYDAAKSLRKELLTETSRKADAFISKIGEAVKTNSLTKMPNIKDLPSKGGIESRRIVEKSDELFDVIRGQVEIIYTWRTKMAAYLQEALVDAESGNETTGDEYEESTKHQDELYAYFDALKALQADLNTSITGDSAPLIDHEAKTLVRAAKTWLDPDVADFMKRAVHAPEVTLNLFAQRDRYRKQQDRAGSIRGLIQEARTLEASMQFSDGGSRLHTESLILKGIVNTLQNIFVSYSKALAGLEKEVDLFRSAQNQRVKFYSQLQELSDAVAPYKEELDKQLDTNALIAATRQNDAHRKTLAQLKTKERFLLHLRHETCSQAEPKICIICQSPFERGVLTICGHQYCKECLFHWFRRSQSCPICKRGLSNNDLHDITYKPQELRAQEESTTTQANASHGAGHTTSGISLYSDVDSQLMSEIKAVDLPRSYGTKIDTLGRHLQWIREHDPGAKSIVFSQYREFLDVLGEALRTFKIGYARLGRPGAADKFRHDPSLDCLLLDAKTDSSGLNFVNATHVFICEPLVQTAVELQAIARVHRIGQTRKTTVWMYLISDTVEEAIYELSVARRLAHVQSRTADVKLSNAKQDNTLQENAIDAANSEELQSAPLTKLLTAGRGGGELVGQEDLWQCLFGKSQKALSAQASAEVDRHIRFEAAEQRRAEAVHE